MMNISIFGLGYVGCISLGCLAKNGHNLIGVDINQNKVELINDGKPTIIEKDIDSIIETEFDKGRISATTDFLEAIEKSDVSILCVGTPSSQNGNLDLSYIFKVAKEIGQALNNKTTFHTVVIRSTVMPGTNYEVGKIIEEQSGKRRNFDFGVVSNPEFLREGNAVDDYYNPSVTVVASDCDRSREVVNSIYEDINAPIRNVSIEEAEIIKYVNNSFHALKISFANEIGNICKSMGIDSRNVMDLFCLDNKLNISKYYFKPGFAYGGSCLPKDLKGIQTMAHDKYLDSPLLEAIDKSNENQKRVAVSLIEKQKKKKIGILGLSFKAGTDDLRYSPIVELAEYFLGKGFQISIYDENVSLSQLSGTNKDYIDEHIPHLSRLLTKNLEKMIFDSEVLVIAHYFKGMSEIIEANENKIFIDLVGVLKIQRPNYLGICW